MKIKADYDVAVKCQVNGFAIYFAAIPSLEVARLILGLTVNTGITLPEHYQTPYWRIEQSESCVSKPEPQRTYYWVDVDPVFEVSKVARLIAYSLQKEHGLTVCYREDPEIGDRSKREIFKSRSGGGEVLYAETDKL